MRALLAALAIASGPALAQISDPGMMLGRVLATFAGAEICGYPLSPEQRHELAAAGLRLQGQAHISNAELERIVAQIGGDVRGYDCERGRAGFPAATAALLKQLRERP